MVTARKIPTPADAGSERTPPGPRPFGPEKPVVPETSAFASLYPFASHWLNVGDDDKPLWMHYVDEGPRDAPVLLCLHGNPTWSFFWRDIIGALSTTHRVIAVDHMGCGLSDRPQNWNYTLPAHVDNVRKLVDTLDLNDVTLAMHDWGGMIGMTWATAHPARMKAFVVINTGAFHGKLPWRIRTVRIPGFGRTAVLGFNAFVKAAVASCTVDKGALSPEVKNGFIAPYDTPHDRIATLRFVEDVPLDPSHPTWAVVEQADKKLHVFRDKPMLICWGEQDWCFTPKFREGWQARFPDAEVHTFDDGAHFLLEEKSRDVVPLVVNFMNRITDASATSAQTDGATNP